MKSSCVKGITAEGVNRNLQREKETVKGLKRRKQTKKKREEWRRAHWTKKDRISLSLPRGRGNKQRLQRERQSQAQLREKCRRSKFITKKPNGLRTLID